MSSVVLAVVFNCTCDAGYEGDGKLCYDVDECLNETHDCSATSNCRNIPGDFICQCGRGLRGDGRSCQVRVCTCSDGINECFFD